MNDLHSENVPTTNWSESPKYAAFELFFKSQGKKEGMKVCKHMPKTTNCSDKGLLTLESLQQKLYSAQERRKVGFVNLQITILRLKIFCKQNRSENISV